MPTTTIYAGMTAVGTIYYDVRPEGVYLHRTEIEPEHRGNGYSTNAIKALLAMAGDLGLPVFIDYIAAPRPHDGYWTTEADQRFYAGLGFREAFKYGKDDLFTRMVWEDPAVADPDTVPDGARLHLLEG